MNKQGARTPEALALRKAGGTYLKGLRTAAQLTQREVALALNMNYYTMIAQMEAGTARIPPDTYTEYAKVLGVNEVTFTMQLLSYYDPHVYKALFADETKDDTSNLSNAQTEFQEVITQVSTKSDADITKVTNLLKAYLA